MPFNFIDFRVQSNCFRRELWPIYYLSAYLFGTVGVHLIFRVLISQKVDLVLSIVFTKVLTETYCFHRSPSTIFVLDQRHLLADSGFMASSCSSVAYLLVIY